MNYRPKILLIFALLLGLMFYGAIGYTQAKTALSTEQSKSATYAEKTSSSNIHIDDIVIKNSTDAHSGNSVISEEELKRLVSKLSDDVEKEVAEWVDRQIIFGVGILLAAFAGIWAFVSRAVEKGIEKHVDKLDKKREEASDATTKVKHEIDLAQETLKEFRKKENEINKKLEDFQNAIESKEKEISDLNLNLDSIKDEFESKVTTEIFRLEQKINALELVIGKIDKIEIAKNQVVEELILDLKGDDTEKKYSAAELLPQFKIESNKITDAFVEILKTKPDITFGSLLLSGLGEIGGDGKTLAYLLDLVRDISHPNILAIIGALGALGDTEKLEDIESGSIVDQLLSILRDDLDNKGFALDITASKVRGAIALALSCYGEKSQNAVKDLISLLTDQEPETRKNAVIALGTIGIKAKSAISALYKLKDDEYIEVRGAASEAIEKIQQSE